MPRDGSGNYVPPNGSWTTGIGDGAEATIADWSALLNDLSNAISQSMSKDGQTSFSNHIPFGTKRAINLGDPVSSQDAVTLSYMTSYVAAASVTYAASAENSTNLNGHPGSWYQQALGYTPVNKAGDTMTGDLTVYRSGAPATGVVFLNQAKDRFLYYNGSSYELNAAELMILGGHALRSNNIKTSSIWPIEGAGAMPGIFAAVSYNETDNSIYYSANVVSITDNGPGVFTVNFQTECPTPYYSVAGITTYMGNFPVGVVFDTTSTEAYPSLKTTTQCKLRTNAGSIGLDCGNVTLIFVY